MSLTGFNTIFWSFGSGLLLGHPVDLYSRLFFYPPENVNLNKQKMNEQYTQTLSTKQ